MDESTVIQVARELGSMDARIGNMEKDGQQTRTKVEEVQSDIAEIKGDMKGMQADIKTLLARPVGVPEPPAGRPLLTIGTTAAGGLGVGGLLVAAAQYVLGGGAPAQPPAPPPYIPPPAVVQPQPQPEAVKATTPP